MINSRRLFLNNFIFLFLGSIIGFNFKYFYMKNDFDINHFFSRNKNLNFSFLDNYLILKILKKQIDEHDRELIVKQLVLPNKHIFVQDFENRIYGSPGFYKV